MAEEFSTTQLLRKWQEGDRAALDSLLVRDLPWIQERVRRRLGPLLRARAETDDFVQEAVAEVLRYAPRFTISDRSHFRALLARIVENVLRDQHDRFRAYRRALHRERPLPPDTELSLDAPRGSVERPSEAAERSEWEAWVRLALELVDPEDRLAILMRNWDGLSFVEMGKRLEISEDAARMRFHRALARLAEEVHRLRSGRPAAWAEGDGEDA